MNKLLTLQGHFSHAAEAQQAVQLLLAEGFTPDTVAVWTQPQLSVTPGQLPGATTDADRRSGRFLTALFGERWLTRPDPSRPDPSRPDPSRPDPSRPDPSRLGESRLGESTPGESTPGESTPGESTPGESTPGDMVVLVRVESVAQADQITDLLERSGSARVTIQAEATP